VDISAARGTIGNGAKLRMRDFAAYYLSQIDRPLALQETPMSADYANARRHREVVAELHGAERPMVVSTVPHAHRAADAPGLTSRSFFSASSACFSVRPRLLDPRRRSASCAGDRGRMIAPETSPLATSMSRPREVRSGVVRLSSCGRVRRSIGSHRQVRTAAMLQWGFAPVRTIRANHPGNLRTAQKKVLRDLRWLK